MTTKTEKKTLKNAVLYILFGYFFMIAFWGKYFAYFHLQLGSLPIYVSEGALALAMVYAAMNLRRPFGRISRLFSIGLILFLGVGTVRLLFSLGFPSPDPEVNLTQILRDSALHYQALWCIFGLALSAVDFSGIFTVLMLGTGLAQAIALNHLVASGISDSKPFFFMMSFGGNEVISPLFPLTFLLWDLPWATLFLMLFGHTFLATFLVYMKKSWVFSVFAVNTPAATMSRADIDRSRAKRIKYYLVGLSLAISLAVSVSSFNSYRATGNPFAFFKDRSSIETLTLHGENMDTPQGPSMLAWRMYLWKDIWVRIQDAPWLGHGFGMHAVKSMFGGGLPIASGKWISGPHNSFLAIAFRTGIAGCLSLLVMLTSIVITSVRFLRSAPFNRDRNVGLVALSAFISALLYSAFNVGLENPHHGIWFWLFSGAFVGTASRVFDT